MGLDRTNETTPPDSSSVLTSGSFRARDEMRRAEQAQLRKLKYSERLDRNIARAGRKGDSASVNSFLNIKRALNDGSMQTPGGISSYEDRQQRVKDGVIKGAEIRWEAGQIGKTQEDPIAGAPPVDSVTPKNRQDWDIDGNGIPNSIQSTSLAPPAAQGGVAREGVAPSAKLTPEALKSRQAFAADLDRSTLVDTDPAARERAYKKGESIGVSRDEVDYRMGWDENPIIPPATGSEPVQQNPDSEAMVLAKKIKAGGMTPEQKARSQKEAEIIERSKSTLAKAQQVDEQSTNLMATRELRDAMTRSGIEADFREREKYTNQVAQDRDVWFEDVKSNAAHSRDALGITAAFGGHRKDAPMPNVDWNAYDKRKKDDPNFGNKRYQSQYGEGKRPGEIGSTGKEAEFKGDKYTNGVMETIGGTLGAAAEALTLIPSRMASRAGRQNAVESKAKTDLATSLRNFGAPPTNPLPL